MTDELKRCPICGQSECINDTRFLNNGHVSDCPLRGVIIWREVWNVRPIEDRLERERDEAQRDLAAARAEVERLTENYNAEVEAHALVRGDMAIMRDQLEELRARIGKGE